RIAMAFTVAGLCSSEPVVIRDCSNVATSFPSFVDLANTLGLKVTEKKV
ncbi:MAG: 3-phosphoshikimate 1-carboxyvinyltransferase, partial [Porticoccaceae bacterium]|nr:3-phosphoshikimate 1-carboxyvinyltransferase [Porticoccaceae bacterium]